MLHRREMIAATLAGVTGASVLPRAARAAGGVSADTPELAKATTAGVDYFLRYFLKQNRDPDRKVFHHVTCATDTANVQVVMDSTRAMIIQDSLNF